jgi:hypothetical protein
LPVPVDALQFIVLRQASRPQLLKDAGSDPLLKAVMSRAAGADAGLVQGVPLAARSQYKENRIHALAVVGRRTTAAESVQVHAFGQ